MTATQYEARYLTASAANPLSSRTRFTVASALSDLRGRLSDGHAIAAAMAMIQARPQTVDALAAASAEVGQESARTDFLAISGP